jgi:hypothetical protein
VNVALAIAVRVVAVVCCGGVCAWWWWWWWCLACAVLLMGVYSALLVVGGFPATRFCASFLNCDVALVLI